MLTWSLTKHVGLRSVVPCVLTAWVRLHVGFFKIKNDIIWLFYTHFSSSTTSLTSRWSSLSTATHRKASSTTTMIESLSSRTESSTWCYCPIWICENTKSASPISSLSLLRRSTFSLSLSLKNVWGLASGVSASAIPLRWSFCSRLQRGEICCQRQCLCRPWRHKRNLCFCPQPHSHSYVFD